MLNNITYLFTPIMLGVFLGIFLRTIFFNFYYNKENWLKDKKIILFIPVFFILIFGYALMPINVSIKKTVHYDELPKITEQDIEKEYKSVGDKGIQGIYKIKEVDEFVLVYTEQNGGYAKLIVQPNTIETNALVLEKNVLRETNRLSFQTFKLIDKLEILFSIVLSYLTSVFLFDYLAIKYKKEKKPVEDKKSNNRISYDKDGKASFEAVYPTIKLDDVRGLDELKDDARRIIDMLKNKDKYTAMGVKNTAGLLFTGPPGTGKTYFAEALAGELGIPLLKASGSSFVNTWVGVGAANIRNLFTKAIELKKAIIFIDELDALGKERGKDNNSERDSTLNELLVEITNLDSLEDCDILIIAATNFKDSLDGALIRSQRFDTVLTFSYPDEYERREHILRKFSKVKVDPDISVDWLVSLTPRKTFADLDTLINNALMNSVYNNYDMLTKEYLSLAFYVQAMEGYPKKKWMRDDKDEMLTAYHEAGHALISIYLLQEKVPFLTIIPSTSGAGGVCFSIPNEHKMQNKEYFKFKVMQLLAGRASEQIFLNDPDKVTVGASSDIAKASEIIKSALTHYGWGKYGLLNLNIFKESPSLLEEASDISKELEEQVYNYLSIERKDELKLLANALYKEKVMYSKQINTLLGLPVDDLIDIKIKQLDDVKYEG